MIGHLTFVDVAPAGLILAITVLHALYALANARTDAQQVIRLSSIHENGGAAHRKALVARGVCLSPDGEDAAPATLRDHAPNRAPAIASSAQRVCLADTHTFEEPECAETLICREDLRVPANTRFRGPVKVAGDLLVSGESIFESPVVVGGYLLVTGAAYFAHGLIAKNDVAIDGHLQIGSRETPGWMVARKCRLSGTLAVNGRVFADEGIERSAA